MAEVKPDNIALASQRAASVKSPMTFRLEQIFKDSSLDDEVFSDDLTPSISEVDQLFRQLIITYTKWRNEVERITKFREEQRLSTKTVKPDGVQHTKRVVVAPSESFEVDMELIDSKRKTRSGSLDHNLPDIMH